MLKLICGVILLTAAAISGAYIWLSAWKWYPLPDFHESWTAEERAALSKFDSYLKDGELGKAFLTAQKGISEMMANLQIRLGGEGMPADERLRELLVQHAVTLYVSHAIGSPMRRELAAIAASGSAKRPPLRIEETDTTDTPARFAVFVGHTDAAKAMIRHGADPNFHDHGMKESLLSSLLSNISLTGKHPLPLNERLAMADWLTEQGTDVRSLRESLRYAPMLAQQEAESILRWLHSHHFGTEPYENGAPVYEFMYQPAEMDFWKEMFSSGKLSINDTRGNKTPIQVICGNISTAAQVQMLEWMLRHGAAPAISAQQEGLFPQEQPLELLLDAFRGTEPDAEESTYLFRAIRLLQKHGATLTGTPLPPNDDMNHYRRLLRQDSAERRKRAR